MESFFSSLRTEEFGKKFHRARGAGESRHVRLCRMLRHPDPTSLPWIVAALSTSNAKLPHPEWTYLGVHQTDSRARIGRLKRTGSLSYFTHYDD